MSPATAMTLGVRWRPTRGPALRRSRLPLGLTLLSAGAHGALVGSVMLAAVIWPTPETKVYVVNLVPAVAGVGVPEAKPAPKPPPETKPAPKPEPQPAPPVEAKPEPKPAPRPPEPAPTVTRSTPAELPQRDAALPARDTRSTPAAEMPARQTPRAPAALPEPELPAAAPTLARPGDKEPPRVASAPRPMPPPPALRQAPPAPAAPVPSTEPAAAPAPVAPPPPAPAAGRPSGSAAGSGAVTLDVTDFPYAYYLLAIQNKITERWQGRALDGRQPVATFQIDRNGRISSLAISKTSGNPYYDQAAMRAVLEAAPFPPLPQDFPGSFLRVHLGFNFSPDRG